MSGQTAKPFKRIVMWMPAMGALGGFMKKFIGTLLVIAGICLLSGCTGTVEPGSGTTEVKVNSISITSESNVVEIEEGSTLQLNATVAPENASNKQVEWLSSDSDCATVDADGLVTVRVENWISPFIGRTEDIEIMEGEE